MHIKLDRNSKTPLYRQVIEQLTEWIRNGDLPPGASLPSVRQLARDLGIGQRTVRQAYDELKASGLLDTRPGGATYVADRPAGVVLSSEREELATDLASVPPNR